MKNKIVASIVVVFLLSGIVMINLTIAPAVLGDPSPGRKEVWRVVSVKNEQVFDTATDINVTVSSRNGVNVACSTNITDWFNAPGGYSTWWDWLNGTSSLMYHWGDMEWYVSSGSLAPISYSAIQFWGNMYLDSGGGVNYTTFMGNTYMADWNLSNPDNGPDIVSQSSWQGNQVRMIQSMTVPHGTTIYIVFKIVITEPGDFTFTVIASSGAVSVAPSGWTVGGAATFLVPSEYTTIQEAIDAASSGDTVRVAAGTYNEALQINKALTLMGVGDTTIIQPSGTGILTSLYTLGTQAGALWNGQKLASIILVQNVGTTGVTIKNLKVDGVNVNGLPGGANYVVGISYGETAGTIENVTVANMNSVPVATRTYGLWLDAVSTTVAVQVKNCSINYFNKNAINVRGAKQTANISNSTIVGPGDGGVQVPNGIMFVSQGGGTARYNEISALHYTTTTGTWLSSGIAGYDGRAGVIMEHNKIHDVDMGIAQSVGSNYSLIRYNELYDCVTGLELEAGASYNNITCNEIHDNYYGIYLLGSGSPYYTGVGDEPGPGNTASFNNIYGNTEGVRNWDTTQTFDAKYNWWGDETGPEGSGDDVVGLAVFKPWLVKPYPPLVPVCVVSVIPDVVTLQAPAFGTIFTVNVTVSNVTAMYGFQFTLTWDSTLLTLTSLVDRLPSIWVSGYDIASNVTDIPGGIHTLAITAHPPSPTFNGTTVLSSLTLKSIKDPQYPYGVDCDLALTDVRIGDNSDPSKDIVCLVYSGSYSCSSVEPKLLFGSSLYWAKSVPKEFDVSVNVTNIVNLYTFDVTFEFDETLLNVVSVSVPTYLGGIGGWDNTAGYVRVYTTGITPPATGNLILATVRFKVMTTFIWNVATPKVSSQLDFTADVLRTESGPISHGVVDGAYAYRPVPGDMNYDGLVDIFDLIIAAQSFGKSTPTPPPYELADFNHDKVVDILDIITLARNFGRTEPPP